MWKQITPTYPEPGVVVKTKIMDADGERNERRLKRAEGNKLWWYPDGSMYVYYTPTHYLVGSDHFIDRPHEDGDYSYLCGSEYCRCCQ